MVGASTHRWQCPRLEHDVRNVCSVFGVHGDAAKFGKDYMHRVLRHFLDRYLRGRAGEIRHEPPLASVQREPYVWYEKGGQIMYALADYIGEDTVNLALHNFLTQYRYANANNQVDSTGNTVGAAAVSQTSLHSATHRRASCSDTAGYAVSDR